MYPRTFLLVIIPLRLLRSPRSKWKGGIEPCPSLETAPSAHSRSIITKTGKALRESERAEHNIEAYTWHNRITRYTASDHPLIRYFSKTMIRKSEDSERKPARSVISAPNIIKFAVVFCCLFPADVIALWWLVNKLNFKARWIHIRINFKCKNSALSCIKLKLDVTTLCWFSKYSPCVGSNSLWIYSSNGHLH